MLQTKSYIHLRVTCVDGYHFYSEGCIILLSCFRSESTFQLLIIEK